MPRVRADNDARYALRASFVDETGAVIEGDTITISSSAEDPRISSTQISNWDTAYSTVSAGSANWDTAYGWGNHASAGYLTFSGTTANTQTTTANWNANFIGTSSGMSFRKTSWSYANNANLTDAGNLTETAGLSTIRWSDGSRNTVLCIAPTTGGSANRVMIYNDQGSSYSPGWREIHTDKNNCVAPSYSVGSCQWQAVTGDFGSMQIDGGAVGGYEGYSIGGRAVFMHNNNTVTGLYNDVNNHWLLRGDHNGPSYMYHAGVVKGYTYGSGWRVTGNLLATGDVYAYYSDRRLKAIEGAIESPLEKISALNGVYYTHNAKARELGYEGSERQVGLIAQEVEAVLPEVIGRAPVDDDGEGGSVTGEEYITVNYQRIVPLLVEAIKELKAEVEELKRDDTR